MFFQVIKNNDNNFLKAATSHAENSQLLEKDIEDLIAGLGGNGEGILDESIFSEELLLLGRQIILKNKKRLDLVALDSDGNLVIIELKKDKAALGVDTQALQYLSALSGYKGKSLLDQLNYTDEGAVESFLRDGKTVDDINQHQRIILIAQSFDPALFSMGEWLSNQGVPFRCIRYTPIHIENSGEFISFSVAFDRSPFSIYRVNFPKPKQKNNIFWFNIGNMSSMPDEGTEKAWQIMLEHGFISAGFEGIEGDKGTQLLKSFSKGDRIIAYISQRANISCGKGGAIAYGVIENDPIDSYKLVEEGSDEDFFHGLHLHRLPIKWICHAPTLSDVIYSAEIKQRFGIHNPVSTSCRIKHENAEKLLEHVVQSFSNSTKVFSI
ncbi:hypothetical protein FLX56_04025 [Synechococcus moorigangaii CMS01]|nr:hypothetical protein [Synechococcus moorigangaii CMS01]